MANTYSQIYMHVVIVVKWRSNLISSDWKLDLFKYINGIVVSKKDKIMCLNGVSDHLHILLSISPSTRISDLVRDIKANSAKWINEQRFINTRFEWQNGFGVFSVSPGRVDRTIDYIKNQEAHHQRDSFRTEYLKILKKAGVEYDEKYIFEDLK
jgi:REP element-mobilizing transposase RayT